MLRAGFDAFAQDPEEEAPALLAGQEQVLDDGGVLVLGFAAVVEPVERSDPGDPVAPLNPRSRSFSPCSRQYAHFAAMAATCLAGGTPDITDAPAPSRRRGSGPLGFTMSRRTRATLVLGIGGDCSARLTSRTIRRGCDTPDVLPVAPRRAPTIHPALAQGPPPAAPRPRVCRDARFGPSRANWKGPLRSFAKGL